VGAGNGPLDGPESPDYVTSNVRSDSLVRWMVYSAVAYGATALNYYCWGGGVWWINEDPTKPGKPPPTFQTVLEANADAGAWGDELLAGGFRFAGALHTGFMNERDGGSVPSDDAIVTRMSEDLLVGVFVPADAGGPIPAAADGHATGADAPLAYLFIVDKRVSGQLDVVPARNVTLALHPSVAAASVARPGAQGARGFDELRQRHGGIAPPPGKRRHQYAHTSREEVRAPTAGGSANAGRSCVLVTVELVGGGGGLVRLYPVPGGAAALIDACFSFIQWTYPPGDAHMSARSPSLNFGLKAPSWAYDSWHARYRPYEGLELTAGRSFEDGEQTNFIVGASFRGAPPPTAADEAEAWAWAGFNLLSVEAPPQDDLAVYGPASAAVGTVLDQGYPFGYFAARRLLLACRRALSQSCLPLPWSVGRALASQRCGRHLRAQRDGRGRRRPAHLWPGQLAAPLCDRIECERRPRPWRARSATRDAVSASRWRYRPSRVGAGGRGPI
jgi:hypothetical protein